ncbi:hypothetical protein BCR37DRAFT_171436 [Protomyces lactucae-debilis]|uniref:Uncharacterized protein n=1 Tax=Protomyces lactucae-debilis TaxID=2754530 RepID=A0A1Y2EVW0_PROLT|nr:uncharacterized protein BCR37DRAFT_171436 [Protomyces lactucae-debilis]ORY75742.1 hypothetical protein BCR37DRAFT_171436 [Protomyces lactucae-debilis]
MFKEHYIEHRFDLLFAGRDELVAHDLPISAVWSDPTCGRRSAHDRLPLRMIYGKTQEEMECYPPYRLHPNVFIDKNQYAHDISSQVHGGSDPKPLQPLISAQYVAAWQKHVVREMSFKWDGVAYEDCPVTVALAVCCDTSTSMTSSARSFIKNLEGNVLLETLVGLYLAPDDTASIAERAEAINKVYLLRPYFDETQLSIEDLTFIFERALPSTSVTVIHPGHGRPYPGSMSVIDAQQCLVKENEFLESQAASGFFPRRFVYKDTWRSSALTIKLCQMISPCVEPVLLSRRGSSPESVKSDDTVEKQARKTYRPLSGNGGQITSGNLRHRDSRRT